MKTIRLLLLVLTLAGLNGTGSAFAEKRIALVIGNQGYAASVGPLKNPFNDIARVANALRTTGFEVKVVQDANRINLLKAIDRYAKLVGEAGPEATSFLYYSGHGAARPSDHVNYLIPIDVPDMSDDSVWYNTVSLDMILDTLTQKAPDASHFVVFDACRSELHVPSDTKGTSSKSFVPMTGRNGQFIAFSTSPNQTASDKGENGGPYAIALASELTRKGQDHLAVFQNVRERVYEATRLSGPQRPIEVGSLLQRIFFSGEGAPTRINVPHRTPADVDRCLAATVTTNMSAAEAVTLYKKCLNPA
ncbi:caspase family protein [Bradyrhizobium sp. CCBAU 53380]|uniref:caspase family protein n=1 Tax=Bradyrhizobium sp. CCBAU 53380 TaxID=1325117 RepID=UPI002302B63B|nr:caspase family protein [Bradyrhizobium sp. CCBAU 53380]MDA9420992.1 hypothetical protein [Bradyrhizobium sp. CCBAU 53380]